MINVLVICDDLWHPAEVIEMGLQPLEGDKYHFVVVKAAKDILTPERIAGYPVIVSCKGNSVTAANNDPWFEEGVTEVCPKEFEEYVRQGGGFLSVHAANTAKEGQAYEKFAGNFFTGHPARCGVDVKITADHPITQGVQDFHIRDEHYQITVTAPDAHELFTTHSETGGDQVGGYVRDMGKGKLCMLTPGHTVDVWYHPEFQKLFTNALEYCMRKG